MRLEIRRTNCILDEIMKIDRMNEKFFLHIELLWYRWARELYLLRIPGGRRSQLFVRSKSRQRN